MISSLSQRRPARTIAGLALLGCLVPGCDPSRCDGVTCPPLRLCERATGDCRSVACPPGDIRCGDGDPSALERCTPTGDWWAPLGTCSPEQTCAGPPGEASCTPPACAAGDTACEADGRIRSCLAGIMLEPVECPMGDTCDPAAGATCIPRICEPGELFCNQTGDSLLRCGATGTSSTFVSSCAPEERCGGGTCVPLCTFALGGEFVGCEYYALDTNNTSYDDPLQFALRIANDQPVAIASITVEVREGPGFTWAPVITAAVGPGATATIPLPDRHVEGTAWAVALAYRVTTSVPVVVWQINALDSAAASSGGTLLRAVSSLYGGYYAMSLPSSLGNDALVDFGAEVHSSGFAVVATSDATEVTITVATPTQAGPTVPALAPGESWTGYLNAGDVLQVEAAGVGDDVTGSYIETTGRSVVFGYHECATIQPGTCDHFEEQLPGVGTWGDTYVVARPPAPGTSSLIRVLSAWEDTSVVYTYDAGVTGFPAASGTAVSLPEGTWHELVITAPVPPPGGSAAADTVIESLDGVLVAQFSTGEVNMVCPPTLVYSPMNVLIGAGPELDDHLTLARRYSLSTVTLDGVSLTESTMWLASEWQIYREPLLDGTHRITAPGGEPYKSGVLITITGEGSSSGYAYSGGMYAPPPGK